MDNNVYVKRCASYTLEEIKNVIKSGFDELGGIEKFIKKDERVLLKPNSLQPARPDTAIVTHPVFIRAVIQVLKEITDKIYVGESPGTGSFRMGATVSGVKKVVEEEKVEFIDFVADKEIEIKDKLIFGKFMVDKRLLEMDKIINLPKIKTHTLMQMSLCVKNMFGIIPGMKKLEYHAKSKQDRTLFAKILIDIYRAFPPHFNIVDGILSMEGDGPGTAGIPVNLGVIIMGENGFVIDRFIPEITGVDPFRVWTNKIYRQYVNGNKDIEFKILGENPGVIKKFIMPPDEHIKGLLWKLTQTFRGVMLVKPVFNKKKCTGCQICVKHCPENAIVYKGRDNGIICDYDKCIRCFCCHELCPENAISIRKPFLRIFGR
ncbi:MAG: DUF362 domain-containing protein [Candidatus Goldbacteria bacterium]|nr:DUF362 domain-containing protein [Candidatus Goldiibacteriota bacterium]